MARTLNNKRILSYSIDILVVAALIAAGVVLAPWLGRSLEIVILCYAVFYSFFRDSFNGAGFGKRLMGLQVVRANARGETVPAEMGIAVVRELFRWIPILNLIDFCLVAFTPDRQQLSDRFLGFSVIETKDKPAFHFSKATLIPVLLPALVATWIIRLPL
jgi:uncharacterized RDD family membrane protein YckC